MYHKVLFYNLPTFSFYLLSSPIILVQWIVYKIRHKDFSKYMEYLRILNEVRKNCRNYTEKDKQDRTTFVAYCKLQINSVSVKCKFRKKATDNNYEEFWASVRNDTGSKLGEMTFKRGYCYFDVIMDYTAIYEYHCDRTHLTVGTGAYGLINWQFNEYPHALIVGDTGQGKTTYVRYLLNGIFSAPYKVFCIDGKNMDYSAMQSYFAGYAQNTADKKDVFQVLEEFEMRLNKRKEEMHDKCISDYTQDPSYEPEFLLIDEYLFIVKQLDKEQKASWETAISNIVLQGRACGFILIITMQRPDTKYISGDLRDNFLLRVVLGKAKQSCYEMMFENLDLKGHKKGWAWYSIGTDLDVMAVPDYKHVEVQHETTDN